MRLGVKPTMEIHALDRELNSRPFGLRVNTNYRAKLAVKVVFKKNLKMI